MEKFQSRKYIISESNSHPGMWIFVGKTNGKMFVINTSKNNIERDFIPYDPDAKHVRYTIFIEA